MANKNPTPRTSKHDIAPGVRNAFWKGLLEVSRRRGKSLPEVMADFIEDDAVGMFNATARFLPRDTTVKGKVDINHRIDVSVVQATTAEFLEKLTGRRIIDGVATVVPDRSLVSDPACSESS